MPNLPPAPCPHPGCPKITGGRRCPKHRALMDRADRALRGSSTARGYDARWRRLRKAKLAADPLCEICLKEGRTEAAEVVDHIVPHRGHDALRLDWKNLQSLSKRCHDRKTATEDSGLLKRRRQG